MDSERQILPVPPPESIKLDKRGRKVVEVYRTETGEYVFGKDNGMEEEFYTDEETKQTKKRYKVHGFEPFSTADRLVYMYQMKKAEARKKKPFMEYVMQLLPMILLTVVIVVGILQWSELNQPAMQIKATEQATAKYQLDTIQLLDDIKNNVQRIKNENEEAPPEG